MKQDDLFSELEDDFEYVGTDNDEIISNIGNYDLSGVTVYSRDWTVQTIISQIEQENIDLNPAFQRRNAWNDIKRSLLIESLVTGYPVPEIVLAEDPENPRKYIVIDGKQRLLTIVGFVNNEKYRYWDKDKLGGLHVRPQLNNSRFSDFGVDDLRFFQNAAMRCTIIANFKQDDILYDIFYRLNTGSVSLSTQELRNVINRGNFTNFLLSITDTLQPLHKVLGMSGPDKRLRDIEILLRVISMMLYSDSYRGNLKVFLDNSMKYTNRNWNKVGVDIQEIYSVINDSINKLVRVFGDYKKVGRKAEGDRRFNRVIFEAEVLLFVYVKESQLNQETIGVFNLGYRDLCKNPDFLRTIESTTKSAENYRLRFDLLRHLINKSFESEIQDEFFRSK